MDDAASSLPFRYRAAPLLTRVSPEVVPTDGSVSIALYTVYTDGPASGENATCFFRDSLPSVRAIADGKPLTLHPRPYTPNPHPL